MKVERSYPGGAQIQKFVRAASSVRKPPESARILNDTLLLGKLSVGDMVARDAMYHTQCLSKL